MRRLFILVFILAQVATEAQTQPDYRVPREVLLNAQPAKANYDAVFEIYKDAVRNAQPETLTVKQVENSPPISMTVVQSVYRSTYVFTAPDYTNYYVFRPSLSTRVVPGVTPNWSFTREQPGIWYRSRLTHF